MKINHSNKRVCSKGHTYYKTSDCPTCPICEQERKPKKGFLSLISSPARRALENKGINSLEELVSYSEADISKLHGIGPGAMAKLRKALEEQGFR